MRTRSWTSWVAGLGAALVVIATFFSWGNGVPYPNLRHAARLIDTYVPPDLRGENAWHAFPVIAGLVVIAASLSLTVHLFPLGSPAQQTILGGSEAAFALILTLAKWVSPPRGHPGAGQPLACAGELLLLAAVALTPLNPRPAL
jgi:hypothetical protein